jgi:sigma-B regulation protein RsbU (phosphoserine phosphatase)
VDGTEPDARQQLDRLHSDAASREEEIVRLRASVRQGEDEIADLRSAAALQRTILRTAQEDLAAAELELDDLRAVRDALTPSALPPIAGVSVDANLEPARRRVSGDFHLVADGPRETVVLVVGDVTGKGIEAARRAVFVRATFAAAAPYADDPADVLGLVNAALLESEEFDERFATAVCATYAPAAGLLRWALAGHPSPLHLATGAPLGGRPGLPLGVAEDVGCVTEALRLAPGDGFLLYTDGLIEARRDGELFGTARAAGIVGEMAGRPSAELLDRLRAEVASFGDEDLDDDLCMLAVRAT